MRQTRNLFCKASHVFDEAALKLRYLRATHDWRLLCVSISYGKWKWAKWVALKVISDPLPTLGVSLFKVKVREDDNEALIFLEQPFRLRLHTLEILVKCNLDVCLAQQCIKANDYSSKSICIQVRHPTASLARNLILNNSKILLAPRTLRIAKVMIRASTPLKNRVNLLIEISLFTMCEKNNGLCVQLCTQFHTWPLLTWKLRGVIIVMKLCATFFLNLSFICLFQDGPRPFLILQKRTTISIKGRLKWPQTANNDWLIASLRWSKCKVKILFFLRCYKWARRGSSLTNICCIPQAVSNALPLILSLLAACWWCIFTRINCFAERTPSFRRQPTKNTQNRRPQSSYIPTSVWNAAAAEELAGTVIQRPQITKLWTFFVCNKCLSKPHSRSRWAH